MSTLSLALVAGLLVSCTPQTDAERLAQALDPQVPLSKAVRGCEQISGQDAQGDCLSAAIALREGTRLEDCQSISSERWRNECVFVLAERMGAEDVDGAIALCAESRFVRECLFHLIQDKAQAVGELEPVQAQRAIEPFSGVKRVPDAATLFWKEWVNHQVRTLDRAVPSTLCQGLEDSQSCKAGLSSARKMMLRGIPSAQRCERSAEERPILALSDGSQALELSPMEMEEIRRTCAASKR